MTGWLLNAISRMPPTLLGVLSAVLGDAWFYLLRIRRAVALQNVSSSALDPGAAGRKRLVRRVCRNVSHNFLELPRWLGADDHSFFAGVEVRGAHHLDRASEAGCGVVVATAHLGNWELLGSVAHRLGHDTTLVVRPPAGRGAHHWVNQQRLRSGVQLIEEGQGELTRMLKTLRDGGLLGITIDQRPRLTPRPLHMRFLGRSTRVSRAVASLSLRTGAPIVVATTYRTGDGSHRVRIEPPIWPTIDVRPIPDRVADLTRECCARVERAITARPDQWLWHHRRWADMPLARPVDLAPVQERG